MNSANILQGPAALYVAPKGTALPDPTLAVIALDPAFKSVGYTEDGVDMNYQPTYKAITVDEETGPVDQRLTDEKATITAKLAEATLDNLNLAISASTISSSVATLTAAAMKTLKVGSGKRSEVVVVLVGVAPASGLNRVVQGYRAIATAAVAQAYKKGDKTLTPVSFELLADSTKPAGERLFRIDDQTAPHS